MAKRDDEPDPREERRDEIRGILDDYNVESFSRDGMDDEFQRARSREYQEYQSTEKKHGQKHWYLRLVDTFGFYDINLGETQKKLDQAAKMMNWELDTARVLSAALVAAAIVFLFPVAVLLLDTTLGIGLPGVFLGGAFVIPFAVLVYVVEYPILRVQQKVIRAADDLILSLLYMVIYMRNSPNIEGAVRFAALNTDGPISEDFKHVLWQAEVGNYTTVEEALLDYAKRWRPYNKDFIQSIELLVEATAEGDNTRRENILSESINNLLDGTRDKMKRYARELRMPVSATFGIGVLLPVLGMILFPLMASFMGGGGLEVYLAFLYNVFLPIVLYIIIYHTLMRRPPSIATQDVEGETLPDRGIYTVQIGERSIGVPALLMALVVFIVLGAWPLFYYFQVLTGDAVLAPNVAQDIDITGMAMLRSLMLTLAMSLSLGTYYYFGNVQYLRRLNKVGEMESEFPEALFQLGNALGRGNPIETGIQKAIGNMKQLDIADMFRIMAHNMNDIGMTFEQAVFDPDYGALRQYPSKLIESVMRALNKSSEKGTMIVSKAMMSISRYLKNIYQTEEEIQEQLGETLATMSFLGFILAPVISGVALGLGTIIVKSFFVLEKFQQDADLGVNESATDGSSELTNTGSLQSGDGLSAFGDLSTTVPPDVLQLVIGVYLIELALLIGMFYVRLTEGKNPVVRKMFTGKVLIVTPILYAITTLILVAIFGGMITGALTNLG